MIKKSAKLIIYLAIIKSDKNYVKQPILLDYFNFKKQAYFPIKIRIYI